MKTTERRHLKENELAHSLVAARGYVEPRKRVVTAALFALLLIVAAVVGVMVLRDRTRAQGNGLLAEAMVALNAPVVPTGAQGAEGVPAAAQIGATGTFATEEAKLTAALPKLQAAADAYPASDAGIQARYHLAGALGALGRHAESIQAFDEVVTRSGADTLYGRMSRLGKADAQARSGQLDAAIASWKEMAAQNAEELPVDAILMDLARAYIQKGNTEEARKTFTQIVDQHPDSPYTSEARAELESLKS